MTAQKNFILLMLNNKKKNSIFPKIQKKKNSRLFLKNAINILNLSN